MSYQEKMTNFLLDSEHIEKSLKELREFSTLSTERKASKIEEILIFQISIVRALRNYEEKYNELRDLYNELVDERNEILEDKKDSIEINNSLRVNRDELLENNKKLSREIEKLNGQLIKEKELNVELSTMALNQDQKLEELNRIVNDMEYGNINKLYEISEESIDSDIKKLRNSNGSPIPFGPVSGSPFIKILEDNK